MIMTSEIENNFGESIHKVEENDSQTVAEYIDKKYQPVRFADHCPLEGYYNDGQGNLYSVARIVDMCKDLPTFEVPLQAFDLSYSIWNDYTIFDLAFHIKAVNDADLSYPIILDWNGAIADGRHRLLKALVLGHTTIKCVRMYWKPTPDKSTN